MKTITLKKLSLLNFKGIRQLKVDFSNTTNIYGNNGTGKTTLFDAFLWLLFGKDSCDRKDFEIKTLDSNNQAFHKMSHEVEATINVDGDEVTIRRTYKENWPTKKGTATETFSGHTTNFYWNEVPLALNEYQKKISAIVDEQLFKLLTNTGFFASMKWQEKRNVLEQIAGDITNEMVLESVTGDFTELIKALNAGKSLSEYRKEISAKKKLIRDEKDLLPSRIDEAKRSLPEPVDYEMAQTLLTNAQGALNNVESQLSNQTLALQEKQNLINGKMREVQNLTNQANEIKMAEHSKVQQGKSDRQVSINNQKSIGAGKRQELAAVDRELSADETTRINLVNKKNELTQKWHAVNNEQLIFNENEFKCPACKREYAATDVEAKKTELTANFNQDKSSRLSQITEQGKKYAAEIEEIEKRISVNTAKKQAIQVEIDELVKKVQDMESENTALSANDEQVFNEALAANKEYQQIISKINELNIEISTPIDATDNTDLLNKKTALANQITEYKARLSTKEYRVKIEDRITELTSQESTMAIELANYEGIEFSIMQFEKAKMDMLEARVNSMFGIVKFKMFETNINGGQEPCCIALINGVPYSDANTASKIQAGVDIINTLSKFYNISAPIFIDNRESVIKLPDTNSQLISLIVSEADTQLRVELSGIAA